MKSWNRVKLLFITVLFIAALFMITVVSIALELDFYAMSVPVFIALLVLFISLFSLIYLLLLD